MSLKQTIKSSFIFKAINPLRMRILKYRESRLTDEQYFTQRHKKIFGYTPDFAHPATFNEKIIHRILFDKREIYTYLADKLKARIYIAEKLANFAIRGGAARGF